MEQQEKELENFLFSASFENLQADHSILIYLIFSTMFDYPKYPTVLTWKWHNEKAERFGSEETRREFHHECSEQ